MHPKNGRYVFVGDVHGCLDELTRLVRKIGLSADDQLVLVGDLVAKGPDSQGVVAFARERGVRAVLGNHDEAVLRYFRAVERGREPPKLKRTHREVAEHLQPADVRYLSELPTYLRFPELNALVVHAGVVPGIPIELQIPENLISMRTIRPDGTASSRLDEGTLWATLYAGPERVVFGHDAITGLQQAPFATGLDTGCVYGGELTALVLPENKLVSVSAKRAYKELHS